MTRLAIIFSLLFVTPAWAEIVLYWQDEFATGIAKVDGSWTTGDFNLERHTLKFDEQKMTLSGFKRPMECSNNWLAQPDGISCQDVNYSILHFHFNKKKSALFHLLSATLRLD